MTDSAIFVCKHTPDVANTTRYQRLSTLSAEYDLTVFTFSPLPDSFEDVNSKRVPDSVVYKLLFPFWVTFHVLRLDERPRFVYTTFNKPALLSGLILKLLSHCWVADLFDDPTLGMQLKRQDMNSHKQSLSARQYATYVYSAILMLIIRPGLHLADLCIFVPDVHEDYGFTESDEAVLSVTNGVSLDVTDCATATPADEFTVFYVGHIQRTRGVDEILDTAERLKAMGYGDDIRFELVGPVRGTQSEWLASELEERDIKNMINLVGPLPHAETLDRMASSDVCLCLLSNDVKNYRRTYPIKLFEYMALGKPIVATDLHGIRTILNDEHTGLLVQPGAHPTIAVLLRELLQDEDMRERLGTNAREAAHKYTWGEINEQVLERIRAVSG